MKSAFADVPWQGEAEWPPEATEAYRVALTRYITVGALRLLAAVHYVDISDIDSSGAAEKDAIVAKCIAARAPFCSPPYLTQFYLFYKLIMQGAETGGFVFTREKASTLAQGGVDPAERHVPASEEGQAVNPVVPDTAALLAQMTELRAQVTLMAASNRVAAAVPAPAPGALLSAAQLQQCAAAAIVALHASQSSASAAPGAAPVPKAKTGYSKALADVKLSIKTGDFPGAISVLKLSRAHKAKLTKDGKTASSARSIQLADGASLTLPAGTDDVVAHSSAHDHPVWSGLSAFNKLFAMMAAMPEEEFSRAALSDMLSVWSTIWDSTNGTRQEKLDLVLAFFKNYRKL